MYFMDPQACRAKGRRRCGYLLTFSDCAQCLGSR